MRVLVTGATGFVGRALVPALLRDGHDVVVWARVPKAARARLGAEVTVVDARDGAEGLAAVVSTCDAVVNLAGEPILGGRWSAARRARLRESRVGTTDALVDAMASARVRPRVFVSASAVGFYGDRGSDIVDEQSSPDDSFLSSLCQAWEAAAVRATPLGIRVVRVRIGVVLGREGGALANLLPPFRAGLGGRIGSGRQYLPWIHLHDLVRVITESLIDERFEGAVNAVAPEPVTNRVFTRTLGAVLRRPAVVPVPSLVLRAILGDAASTLLASQRVEPGVLRALGFSFLFPTLEAALTDLIIGSAVAVTPLATPVDPPANVLGRRYLEARPPVFELRTVTKVPTPIDRTFAFFSKAENLGLLTPASMHFAIHGRAPEIGEGVAIDYRLRMGLVPIVWRSRIVNWLPGVRFVDLQESGPYRSWWHEHSFEADGDVTLMEDRVCYTPPRGVLGRIVNRLFIVPTLRRIFQYRADVIRLRFGSS